MQSLPLSTLVLGGAKSGKSRFAESLIEAAGGGVYVATAEAGDSEMAGRIARHRARRGAEWETLETPLDLVPALASLAEGDRPVLVDCLTLWATNLMLAERDTRAETEALCEVIVRTGTPIVFVTNEVGLGIVPMDPLARRFRDVAGAMNQSVAAACQTVWFVAAGLPLRMK